MEDRAQQAMAQERLNEERKKMYEQIYLNEYMTRQKQNNNNEPIEKEK